MEDIKYIKIGANVCEEVYNIVEKHLKDYEILSKKYEKTDIDLYDLYNTKADFLKKLLPHLDGMLTDFVQKRI